MDGTGQIMMMMTMNIRTKIKNDDEDDESYAVMKVGEVKIAKELKRSDNS